MEKLELFATTKYKVELPSDDSEFWMYGSTQVQTLLQNIFELHEKFILCSAENEFAVSCLLELDDKKGTIKIDKGTDEKINKILIKEGRCLVKSMLSGIELIFELEDFHEGSWSGFSCFEAKIPKRVHRLQRRESFRLQVPKYYKLSCSMPIKNLEIGTMKEEKFSVLDVSLGGICISDGRGLINIEDHSVQLIKNCCCVLPIDEKYDQYEKIIFDLEVRNIRTKNDSELKKIGCKFLNLSRKDETALNKFLIKLQHEVKQKI